MDIRRIDRLNIVLLKRCIVRNVLDFVCFLFGWRISSARFFRSNNRFIFQQRYTNINHQYHRYCFKQHSLISLALVQFYVCRNQSVLIRKRQSGRILAHRSPYGVYCANSYEEIEITVGCFAESILPREVDRSHQKG